MSSKPWLTSYLNERSNGTVLGEKDNFIAAGVINSFGIVELILAIETEFSISLTEDMFQHADVFTINGLSELIDRQAATG
ncbi:MAG: acyl carrier protein [Nisaea sp.]|uniref:acyl carrier protein n=1 Tax=Nisaea sp. TaxID=2024842 RepID=UPI003265AC73